MATINLLTPNVAPLRVTPRARYVLEHYRLERTPTGWRAVSEHGGVDPQTGKRWATRNEITGPDREDVTRRARCLWGHFNFQDEAEAFGRIFPPRGARA